VVDQGKYMEYQRNTKWKTKKGFYHCKETISSLIVKGLIPVWGLKVLIENSSIAGSWVTKFLRLWGRLLR
jgi:hypothetical protein